MNRAKQLVADLECLQAAGLTNEQLRMLHHWSVRSEAAKKVSFSTALNYFKKDQELKENNSAFAERIRYIADRHRQVLTELVEQALAKYPI